MKNTIIFLFLAALFVQCTHDQEFEEQSANQDIFLEQGVDLSKQIPAQILDNSDKGLYVGTVVTTDLSFHEKIFINIDNDGQIFAQVSSNTVQASLIKGVEMEGKENVYQFNGQLGSFVISLQNKKASITDATFLNKEARVNVLKSTSTARMMPSLGTFTNSDNTMGGTWDIMFTDNGGGYTPESTTIVKDGVDSYTFANLVPNSSYGKGCNTDMFGNTTGTIYLNVWPATGAMIENHEISFNISMNAQNFGAPCAYPDKTEMTQFFGQPLTWSWNQLSGTFDIDLTSLPDIVL